MSHVLSVFFVIRFKHVESSTFYGWQFSWNPCLPFTEGTCQNVAVSVTEVLHRTELLL